MLLMSLARREARVVGHRRLVPEDDPAVNHDIPADVAVAAEDGLAHDGIARHPAVRPDNGAVDDRVLLNDAVAADDAVGMDPGAGLDDRAAVDETRPLDRRAVFDLHARSQALEPPG